MRITVCSVRVKAGRAGNGDAEGKAIRRIAGTYIDMGQTSSSGPTTVRRWKHQVRRSRTLIYGRQLKDISAHATLVVPIRGPRPDHTAHWLTFFRPSAQCHTALSYHLLSIPSDLMQPVVSDGSRTDEMHVETAWNGFCSGHVGEHVYRAASTAVALENDLDLWQMGTLRRCRSQCAYHIE